MKTLDRYLIRNLLAGFALLALILVSLFSLLDLVNQVSDVGKGAYTLGDALIYVALTVPRRLLELLPFTGLLGSLLALGWLAESNELMAMRAAGLSRLRMAVSTLAAAAILVLVGALLTQFIAPGLDHMAQTRRTLAISGPIALRTQHSFWSHSNRRFINVRQVRHGRVPADIDIYHFAPDGRLEHYIHAARADIQRRGLWLLQDVETKTTQSDGAIQTRHYKQMTWHSFLTAKQVGVLILPPNTLSMSDLYHYVQGLQAHRENARRYSLAFWQQAAMPLTISAMALIALPFVFGSRREMGTGARLTLGAILGVGFYIVNQASARGGLLFGINTVVAAITPSAVLLIAALALLRRRG